MPTFKIQGQVYHLIGSLLPTDVPRFLQIYFVDNYQEQANIRQQHIPNLDSGLVSSLQNMLHNVNPYVNSFKAALESVSDDECSNYKFVITADKRPIGSHPGRYNAPTTNEVAVLLVDQDCDRRDIVICTHDDRLQRISETHRAYDSLQYPLMFCRGEDGYNFGVYNVDPRTGAPNFNKKTSAMQFYSFLIQLRENEHIFLHRFRGLFNQFLVDVYAKIETERLVFIRANQKKLRAENYIDLRDALQHDADAENLEKLFGAVRCYMFSIEWQKRGLPHSHNLLWLEEKIRPNEIDRVISAEIPNPDTDPILHNIVKTNMIHGPCGSFNTNSPCMKEGLCTKRFPKKFVNETVTGENGYPSYRRRAPQNGGFTAEVNMRGQYVSVDNRWVVPYSPVLSRAFETHLNVEYCASVESIKYICKYVNKGSDQATFGLQSSDRDEVTKYQSGRYISTSEAVWRILGFSIHERHPPVMHLDVHLENGQRVYFNPENVRERLENPPSTTLLAYFNLCQQDSFAQTLLYNEIPSYYTYNKQRGVFNRRRRGQPVEGFPDVHRENAIGRVYTVHPSNSECYYLRLLLHTVRGATSYKYLKTVNGVEHSTFHGACCALCLLDDDRNWFETLEEAVVSETPSRLRHLFAVMIVFCGLSHPVQLWEKYQRHLLEDFLFAARRADGDSIAGSDERVINRCLSSLQDIVISISGNPLSHYGLPEPQETTEAQRVSREYAAETNYSYSAMTEIVNNNSGTLTDEQKSVYNKILTSVNKQDGETFFLDAPGGTGKTFLTRLLLAEVRRQGKIALAVASSGIAATLLPGGKTAHTMFKIPLNLDINETPVCAVSRNSEKAKILAECSLIVWDECTMAHKKAVEAVNRTLQDIRRNNHIMGRITVLFCGDFRQTLPVITRGTRADEVNACLKCSVLWPRVQKLSLTRNMRAHLGGNPRAQEFSDALLKIGEGSFPESNGLVTLPENLCKIVPSVEELIYSVYGDVSQITHKDNNSWLCERAILTPKNDQAAAINHSILEKVAGDE
ncbi:uncharacterized protein LOC118756745, partial [Rhagoletis pomonella]